jgi:hypothetical protein
MTRARAVTTAARLTQRERVNNAIELRKQGHTLRQIADLLGWRSIPAVHKAIREAIDGATFEAVDEMRTVTAERYDGMIKTYYPLAVEGDTDAAMIVLRIEAQRARLFGLDAPVKTEVSGPEGGPIEIVDIEKLVDDYLGLAAGSPGPEIIELTG